VGDRSTVTLDQAARVVRKSIDIGIVHAQAIGWPAIIALVAICAAFLVTRRWQR
jgi:hypothetical protein